MKKKYEITEDHCKCYLENFQYAYTCQHDARMCSNYEKCAEIRDIEDHGGTYS